MALEIQPSGVVLVRLADDPQFTAELEALAGRMPAAPARIVVDLSGVRYLNSSNLARLLRLRRELIEADGKLAICGGNSQVQSVFRATGLDRIFLIASDVADALRRITA